MGSNRIIIGDAIMSKFTNKLFVVEDQIEGTDIYKCISLHDDREVAYISEKRLQAYWHNLNRWKRGEQDER